MSLTGMDLLATGIADPLVAAAAAARAAAAEGEDPADRCPRVRRSSLFGVAAVVPEHQCHTEPAELAEESNRGGDRSLRGSRLSVSGAAGSRRARRASFAVPDIAPGDDTSDMSGRSMLGAGSSHARRASFAGPADVAGEDARGYLSARGSRWSLFGSSRAGP
jgi:hypothetical protein